VDHPCKYLAAGYCRDGVSCLYHHEREHDATTPTVSPAALPTTTRPDTGAPTPLTDAATEPAAAATVSPVQAVPRAVPLGFAPYTAERKPRGAGILFVSHDGTQIYLGKDYTRNFAEFGGRADFEDRTPFDTAVRETSEESFRAMDRFLRRQDWVMANLVEIVDLDVYMCFVIRVPADVNLPDAFEAALARSRHNHPEMTGVAPFDTVKAISACKRRGGLAEKIDGQMCELRDRTRRVLRHCRIIGTSLFDSEQCDHTKCLAEPSRPLTPPRRKLPSNKFD
jgi:hypothetical protein